MLNDLTQEAVVSRQPVDTSGLSGQVANESTKLQKPSGCVATENGQHYSDGKVWLDEYHDCKQSASSAYCSMWRDLRQHGPFSTWISKR